MKFGHEKLDVYKVSLMIGNKNYVREESEQYNISKDKIDYDS